MPSIKDVAQAAGVSTATVSRVLSNNGGVRPQVRERVLTAVEQLDYRPNLVARSLRAQQTKIIGLIVSDIRNPFFTAISRAVEDTAYEQEFSVFLCNADEDPQKEEIYLNLMRDENVAGVIVSPTQPTAAQIATTRYAFPLVVVDRAIPHGDVDSVLLDNIDAGYRLTTHLLENGYRRIAVICGEKSTTAHDRRAGYEKALRAQGILPAPEYTKYVPTRMDVEAGYGAAVKLLDLATPPEALLTTNSLLAAGALQAVRERNLRIPQDVALVGFDDTTWAALVQPAMTVIAQPTHEIGKSATDLLLQRIADPTRPTRQVMLKGQLLVRGSSAPRHERVDNPARTC